MAAARLKAEAQGVNFALAFVRMTNDNCRYNAAEHGAHRALVLDPLFMKARYCRVLARRGNLELARAALYVNPR